MHTLKFIDLFAGIGGFRIALEELGAECVFSSEWDKNAQITYYENFREQPFGDITKISSENIPYHDILAAGFPCQPFSISGKRLGFNDTRGTLFFDIARIIKYHMPKLVILENVRNFSTHDQGKTLNVVENTMYDLGYSFFYKVLNASDYGLPQNRQRIFMLGFRNDLKVSTYDFPTYNYKSVYLEDFLENDSKISESLFINRPDINIDFEKYDPNFYANKPIRIGTINKGGQGERIYSIKGHAITLSAYGGGAGSKTGAYYVNGNVRKLSPRECARIQGFPDSFVIPVSNAQAWKQFGNSIPVNVIRTILADIDKKNIITFPNSETLKFEKKFLPQEEQLALF